MGKLDEKELLTEYYDEILNIINTLKVGVFIADKEGNVLMMNKESERTGGGVPSEEVIGKNMTYLESVGYVDESSVLKSLEVNGEYSLIQKLADGSSIYLTADLCKRDGETKLVICTERDITETKVLQKLLEEEKEKSEKQAVELEYLRAKNKSKRPNIVTNSKEMKKMLMGLRRVAQIDATVLIMGESGTGKEVVADYIYNMGSRVDKPFIKINCAAIPETLLESELFGYEKGAFTGADEKGKMGIFEMANGGTLFLDEIGEMPMQLQAKLLRVLQEREIRRIGGKESISVNVRIISATNANLKQAIEEGKFREDLYYRLNVVPVNIPPLRERKEDIEALAYHFVDVFSEEYKVKKHLTFDAVDELMKAPWPGNIRELRNVIERLVVSYEGENITAQYVRGLLHSGEEEILQVMLDKEKSLGDIMEEYEKNILKNYLEKYYTAAEVARKLQVDKSTIGRKLKKYNLL